VFAIAQRFHYRRQGPPLPLVIGLAGDPQLPGGLIAENVYLNARAPLLSRSTLYLFWLSLTVFLLFVFLYAFTGKRSPFKNRLAIMFSYIVIFVFLALPLIAPVVLLNLLPDLRAAMKETAVGLLITKPDDRPDSKPQWMLNIGGRTKKADPADPDVVDVEGDLTIPLYVLVLSVIGGAINMTRQAPRFQKEGEEAESSFVSVAYDKLVGYFGGRRPPVERKSPAAGAQGVAVSQPSPTPQGQEDSRTRASDWRTELLHQYMFLISAPFLAIATYYMLLWLDLTKTPILVLVSFSVGLISEPVLRAITDLAYGFIRQQPATSPRQGGQKPTAQGGTT